MKSKDRKCGPDDGGSVRSAFGDELFEAYQKEDTLFVRESYLTALQSYDVRPYLPYLKERQKELLSMEMADNEKKHLEQELHALSDLILLTEGNKKHTFHDNGQTFHCILRTNPFYPEVTADQVKELDHIKKLKTFQDRGSGHHRG
jgi:hypothetical protein